MKLFTTLTAALLLWGSVVRAEPPSERVDYFTPPSYEGFEWDDEQRVGIFLYRIQDGNDVRDIMMFQGDFTANTTEIIKFFMDQYPEIKELSMHSPGGLAFESFELGGYLSDKQMNVTVSPGAVCLSACAYAFIGGMNYRVDGILGFHVAFIDPGQNGFPPGEDPFNLPGLNNAYQQGQYTGSVFAQWFLTNGFNIGLVDQIVIETSQEKFLTFTHEDELMRYYVRDDAAENDTDGIIKYLSAIPDVPAPVIMNGDEMMEWSSNNQTHNDRGRPIIGVTQLWPVELP